MNGPTLGYSPNSGVNILAVSGLMLYSPHQSLPADLMGEGIIIEGSYNGKNFEESTAESWNLTDQQRAFLKDDNVRRLLIR